MRFIPSSHPALRYSGRNGITTAGNPLWVFPYSSVSFRCTGTALSVVIYNFWNYGDIRLGAIVDGTQFSIPLPTPAEPDAAGGRVVRHPDGSMTVRIADHLPDIDHDVTIFKRQDGGMHYLALRGIEISNKASIAQPQGEAPARRIEFYGDSVTAGERNEAVEYCGKADPEADLSAYSNSWFSYAAVTARNLGADARLIAQGGIPLLNGTGWFHDPQFPGMEQIWDSITYVPSLNAASDGRFAVKQRADFTQWTPQAVVVALGQNDAHPRDIMAEDPRSEAANHWRQRYGEFLGQLRQTYPDALIVAATTIMEHGMAWDCAIDEAVRRLADPRIVHFLYSRNGSGTPGHPRIPEDMQMAMELTQFLEGFGEGLWAAR